MVIGEPYHLLTGVGYGPSLTKGFQGPGGVEVRQPHNDYLETFARLGIPGLVCFVGLLAAVFLPVLRAARRASGEDARFLWWVVTAMFPYLVIAAAQPLLAFPFGTVPLFTIAGVGLAIVDRARVGPVTRRCAVQ
jgi:O-antigen ligase